MAITKDTVIEISPSRPDLRRIAVYLADLVQPALEASLAIREGTGQPGANVIRLEIAAGASTGDEGYELTITKSGATDRVGLRGGGVLRIPDLAAAAAVVD